MVFKSSLTSPCIVGMACIIMSLLQDVEGLTKELYFIILSRRKTSFHAQFQVQCLAKWFTCFDIGMTFIIMYCLD